MTRGISGLIALLLAAFVAAGVYGQGDQAKQEAPKQETPKPAATPFPSQPVQDILDRARQAFEHGQYTEAIAGYTEVAGMTNIDPALVQRAKLGKAWAITAKAEAENPVGWAAVRQSIVSLWKTSLTGLGTLAG